MKGTAGLFLSLIFCVSRAEWIVTSLHSDGFNHSGALCTTGAAQGGTITILPRGPQACFWQGSAKTLIILHPTGSSNSSRVIAIEGDIQAGYATSGVFILASLWTGTVESWTVLNPPGIPNAYIYDMAGGQQVGAYSFSPADPVKACLWYGTPESWVDLHPEGATASSVASTNGEYQVGRVILTVGSRAALWQSTPESWVDLHPAFASFSTATGISPSGDQQVGYLGAVPIEPITAGYWSGTSESWVSLHPKDAITSRALATDGVFQVGNASIGSPAVKAALWAGTPESYFSLHDLLPAEFGSSTAYSIFTEEDRIVIVGLGYNSALGRQEALLWEWNG